MHFQMILTRFLVLSFSKKKILCLEISANALRMLCGCSADALRMLCECSALLIPVASILLFISSSPMCFVHKQKQRHTPLPKNIYINKLPIVRPCGQYVYNNISNNYNLREFALLTYGRAGAITE